MRRPLVVAVVLAWVWAPSLGTARAGDPAGANRPRVDALGDPLPKGALARLGSTRLSNGGQIGGLAYSPCGKWLASSNGSGVVHLWDAVAGKEVRALKPPLAGWGPLAFSPDSKILASSAGGKLVCLWQPHTGRLLRRLVGPAQMIRSVAFSPDSRLVAAGGGDGTLFLWDVPTGKTQHVLKGHRDAPQGLAFAPDGKTLVSTGHDGTTRLWDVATGREQAKFAANHLDSAAVLFAAGGKTLITAEGMGGGHGTIRYWDVATRKLVHEVPGHPQGTLCLALSADGKILASGGYDRVVRFWDAATTAELGQIPVQSGWVNHLALSPDGATVAWGTFYGSRVRLGQVAGLLTKKFQFKELLPRGGHESGIGLLAFSGEGKKILSTSSDNEAILWDELSGKELHRFKKGYIAALSPDGKRVALADVNDGQRMIHVHDTADGKEIRRYPGHDQIYSLAFSPNGKALICGGINGSVEILEMATGKARLRLPGHTHGVYRVVLAPDGCTLASSASDGVRLRDTISGKELSRVPLPMVNRALAISRDGKILACGVWKDRAIVLWDVAAGREIRRLSAQAYDLVFTPDNQTLAAACLDHTVRVWDVATGKLRHEFRGHAGWVMSLALAPGGRTLVSGSTDTTLLLWTMEPFIKGKPVPAARLSAKELRERCHRLPPGEWPQWWADLALADAEKAHRAIWGLASEPKESLPVMQKWFAELGAAPIDKLIADLDHNEFARREAASQKLARLGRLAEPALRRARARQPGLESRRRIERLLARLETGLATGPDEGLRVLRALEVLEHVASPEARALLTGLTRQAPTPEVAQEAGAALERLALQQSPRQSGTAKGDWKE